MIKIPFKKFNENAVIPTRSHEADAGFDLTCVSVKDTDKYIQYNTGIGMHIPIGYVGLIFPRSSITKKDLMLKNSVGVIDSGYLGEISFRFWKLNHNKQIYKIDVNSIPENFSVEDYVKYLHDSGIQMKNSAEATPIYEEYEIGDRIGQIIIFKLPEVSFKEVDELEDSERGAGGYGSTDKVVIPEVPISKLKTGYKN